MRAARRVVGVAALVGAVAACGSNEQDGVPRDMVLLTQAPVCAGQRAAIPASGERTFAATTVETVRVELDAYVAYRISLPELFVYLSFKPGLPLRPTTDQLRTQLDYAYVKFSIKQTPDLGGALQILSPSQTFSLAAFELLEARDGQLSLRLTRSNVGRYIKRLSIYDDDPTNDPPAGELCVESDIGGECVCEFGGPPVTVTLNVTAPL